MTLPHARGVLDTSTVILLGSARRSCSRPRRTSCRWPSTTGRRAFGRVAASLRRAGRKPAARAYDALIAANALANDLPVYTASPRDFAGIEELELVPVPVPSSNDPIS